MAIEAISSNVVAQQMPKVEKTAPVEKTEAVVMNQQPEVTARPIVEAQGSGDRRGQDREKGEQDNPKTLQEVSPEKVKSAISDINKKIAPSQTQLQFAYHEKTHRISITVRDKDTDEVIREIPPEKTLDMIAKSLELAGILVDEKR